MLRNIGLLYASPLKWSSFIFPVVFSSFFSESLWSLAPRSVRTWRLMAWEMNGAGTRGFCWWEFLQKGRR